MTKQKKPSGLPTRGHSPATAPNDNNFDSKPLLDKDQPKPAKFLIGSKTADDIFDNTCPYATTVLALSAKLDALVIIAIRCKRWGCSHCGQRKMAHYSHLVGTAQPNRLITLTVANKLWETPRIAFDETKRKVTQLAVRLRRLFGEVEYFKVLEVTKAGWPHYHLVTRSQYIPQPTIRDIWQQLTGAHIVDVRQIKRAQDVYSYVIKYLGKQKYVPWTDRRVSWSRHFFPKPTFAAGPGLKLYDNHRVDRHPDEVIKTWYRTSWITAYSNDCWIVHTDDRMVAGTKIRKRWKRIPD